MLQPTFPLTAPDGFALAKYTFLFLDRVISYDDAKAMLTAFVKSIKQGTPNVAHYNKQCMLSIIDSQQ